MKDLNELRRKRGQLIKDCRDMLTLSESEKRAFTAEEQTKYDRMFNEATSLGNEVAREEALREAERGLEGSLRHVPADGHDAVNEPEKRYHDVIVPLIRKFFSKRTMTGDEARALQADLGASGGYLLAPQQFIQTLIKNVDDLLFIRGLATVHTLTQSDSMGAPSLDADPADAEWTGEITTAREDSTMSIGKRELKTHPLKKLIKVSNKLLELSADAEALVRSRLAYKLARVQENAYLNGSGSGQPLGVFTASAQGVSTSRDVSTGNEATEIAADNLIEMKYALKGQYWPKAQWVGHRDWVKRVFKLKDSEGQYLWQPGLQAGQPDRLLNFPVNMSELAPNTFTANSYVAVLGDFSNYWIADALQMTIKRLDELYAVNSQTGFIIEAHGDGMPVCAEAFVRSKMGS